MNRITRDKRISRRTFLTSFGASGLCLAAAKSGRSTPLRRNSVEMENDALRVIFDESTGLLTQIDNKLTKESVVVKGDAFEIVAKQFKLTPETLKLQSVKKKSIDSVEATYSGEGHTVITTYRLAPTNHFFEKYVTITAPSAYDLSNLVVSKLSLSGPAFKLIKYPYQKNVAYFARSDSGGLFTGLELPYDGSSLGTDGTLVLGYKPSLRVKQGERVDSEPIFMGVYRRRAADIEEQGLPLSSRIRSDGSNDVRSCRTSPSRTGRTRLRVVVRNGSSCLSTESQVQEDMRSIDFLAECGLDGLTDSRPWDGETERMNALRQGDHYAPGPLVAKFLGYAKAKKMNVVFWPTMNSSDPWNTDKTGRPFRSDRPDWVMFPEGITISSTYATGGTGKEFTKGNCIANEPFWKWLIGIQLDGHAHWLFWWVSYGWRLLRGW